MKGRLSYQPIKRLRHPPKDDKNGWHIWCGNELS
jgi:hypothetical protein